MTLDIVYDPPERKNNNQTKALKWIIVDALIIAALACVAELPAKIPDAETAWYIIRLFLYTFVTQIAVEWFKKRRKKVV